MAIERKTEGTLLLDTRVGTTAKVSWVVGSDNLKFQQGDKGVVVLHRDQFKELMEASLDIYKDIGPQVKE